MIQLKVPVTFKHFFLANLYARFDNWFHRILWISLGLLSIFKIIKGDNDFVILVLGVSLLIYLVFPFLNFIYIKRKHKQEQVEYFFGDDALGFAFGDYRTEVKKAQVVKITFKKNRIKVQLNKSKLSFIAEPKDILAIKKKMLHSTYAEFLSDGAKSSH